MECFVEQNAECRHKKVSVDSPRQKCAPLLAPQEVRKASVLSYGGPEGPEAPFEGPQWIIRWSFVKQWTFVPLVLHSSTSPTSRFPEVYKKLAKKAKATAGESDSGGPAPAPAPGGRCLRRVWRVFKRWTNETRCSFLSTTSWSEVCMCLSFYQQMITHTLFSMFGHLRHVHRR